MNIANFALDFLDRLGLCYLPENHCLPAYTIQVEKTARKKDKKTAGNTPDNSRNITAGFRAVPSEENEVVVSVWESGVDARLTPSDVAALTAAGLSVKVAEVVKMEKLTNALSTRQIVAKHHVPGATDGFSKGNVDKIAKLVCPSR